MSEERYKLIKENVYTRCHIAEYTGIGLSCPDKEEIELIDYVEELKDQLQQKDNIIKEVREYIKNNTYKIEWGDLEQDNEDININEDLTDKEFIENLLEILDKGVNKGE